RRLPALLVALRLRGTVHRRLDRAEHLRPRQRLAPRHRVERARLDQRLDDALVDARLVHARGEVVYRQECAALAPRLDDRARRRPAPARSRRGPPWARSSLPPPPAGRRVKPAPGSSPPGRASLTPPPAPRQ